jgi:hypothetical protein
MTVVVPSPVDLPMPPGDVEALRELVSDVAGAAFWLTTLGDRLAGPAGSAPGWLGADAGAAAAQIVRVAALTRDAAVSVLGASGRLTAHADLLADARRQVGLLRTEQDEDFRAAWRRLARITHFQVLPTTEPPEAYAIVADLEAAEASRRRRCAALLEEVEDDAAAAGQVLADACAVVGGRGVRGDGDRVMAHLAAEWPGWGDLEMARRGRVLAGEFGEFLTPGDRDARALAALPYAGSAAFADALLAAMGPVRVRESFAELGDGSYRPDSALARLMAQTFGAAAAGGGTAAAGVLSAGYVSPRDEDARDDLVVLGMGTVLAASLALGARGLAPATVAAWGRQIAAREHALGAGALDRIHPLADDAPPVDALPVVVAILAGDPGPPAAATFLTGPDVWDTLLARAWEDCGTSLRHLVGSAGRVEGLLGERVVRGGLEAVAAGLDDGDAGDWPVHRAAANAVRSALAEGIAAHPAVVGLALTASAAGQVAVAEDDLLRGLGFVTLDRPAAAVIGAALEGWAVAQPVPEWVSGPPPLLPAVVVPNAYLAVQEYGQELAHSLNELELEREADDRALLWRTTVGLAASFAPGPYGVAAGLIEGYAAMWLGFDGTWEPGTDHGPTYRPDVLDPSALTQLTPDEWTAVDRMAEQAEDAFDETARALGPVETPKPRPGHWWDPILDAALPGPADALRLGRPRRGHLTPD